MKNPAIEEGLAARRECLARARRVVVKVGSAVLTGPSGLDHQVMENLAEDLSFLIATGREVALVSSGAVAAGRRRLGLVGRDLDLRQKQAAAAVGQSSLMQAYETVFGPHNRKVAQILLTHDDFSRRDRYLNMRNTLFTLLEWGILPIINENDTVSVKELRFGDNDALAAMLTNLIEADLCICLTDVNGLYTDNPATNPDAKLVLTVPRVDDSVAAMAGNVVSGVGTGGMKSKIVAARMSTASGAAAMIGPGKRPGILKSLFAGEQIGTFFMPREGRITSRKHWIGYTLRPKGSLILDDGACNALVQRGTSLLPAGVVGVKGVFGYGDPVHCEDRAGKVIAAGLVNYPASEIIRIQGRKTSEIAEILGHQECDEVIHRDNLVILQDKGEK